MTEVLTMILEKVKAGSLSVEEGVMIIEKLIVSENDKTRFHKKHNHHVDWGTIESELESKFKKFFSKILNDQNVNEWEEVGEKISKDIKKTLKDWLDKENPQG